MLAEVVVVLVIVRLLAEAVLRPVGWEVAVLDLTPGMEPRAVQTQVVAVAVEEDRLLLQQVVQA